MSTSSRALLAAAWVGCVACGPRGGVLPCAPPLVELDPTEVLTSGRSALEIVDAIDGATASSPDLGIGPIRVEVDDLWAVTRRVGTSECPEVTTLDLSVVLEVEGIRHEDATAWVEDEEGSFSVLSVQFAPGPLLETVLVDLALEGGAQPNVRVRNTRVGLRFSDRSSRVELSPRFESFTPLVTHRYDATWDAPFP